MRELLSENGISLLARHARKNTHTPMKGTGARSIPIFRFCETRTGAQPSLAFGEAQQGLRGRGFCS